MINLINLQLKTRVKFIAKQRLGLNQEVGFSLTAPLAETTILILMMIITALMEDVK